MNNLRVNIDCRFYQAILSLLYTRALAASSIVGMRRGMDSPVRRAAYCVHLDRLLVQHAQEGLIK